MEIALLIIGTCPALLYGAADGLEFGGLPKILILLRLHFATHFILVLFHFVKSLFNINV